ncbi:MAG: glycosyltransferase [Candidatus Kaiserbacteria bacterium]|nr:glycosyltransferase [Candidatus Kaiserbacteria bacterium]
MLRLLFITKDASVIDSESTSYHRITDLREKFSEIHIVLIQSVMRGGKKHPLRPFNNVWLYPTNARSLIGSVFEAYAFVKAQLLFGGNFRADVIVADDTHEAGMLGWFLSERFHRPLQLQMRSDFFTHTSDEQKKFSLFYEMSTDFLFSRVKNICVATDEERDVLVHEYDCEENTVEVLPSEHVLNFQGVHGSVCDLHERYPQFKSILLYIPQERKGEQTALVLQELSKILRGHREAGLVVLSDGPERLMLERLVISLGVQRQVAFEVRSLHTASYVRTADMLIHFSHDAEESEPLFIAGMARTPIITDAVGVGGRLFRNGESAYLCRPEDGACLTMAIDACLKKDDTLSALIERAHEIVQEYFKNDYSGYLEACAKSINTCAVLDSGLKK